MFLGLLPPGLLENLASPPGLWTEGRGTLREMGRPGIERGVSQVYIRPLPFEYFGICVLKWVVSMATRCLQLVILMGLFPAALLRIGLG